MQLLAYHCTNMSLSAAAGLHNKRCTTASVTFTLMPPAPPAGSSRGVFKHLFIVGGCSLKGQTGRGGGGCKRQMPNVRVFARIMTLSLRFFGILPFLVKKQ